MIFIPAWIINFTLLGTCWLAGYQMVRLRLRNPVLTIQFAMILFCLLLVLAVANYSRINPWLSLAFLLVAIINLIVIVRQHRMLPPKDPLR